MQRVGQVELVVQLSYVVFLGLIGAMMLQESLGALRRARKSGPMQPMRRNQHGWVHRWPLKMKFRASGLYISVIPPLLVGLAVGVLAAVMGVGGGFILVPAMLYILRMRAGAVVGTSLFQIIITTAITTILQAGRNQTVDIVLSTILLLGGVVGAQIGARFAGLDAQVDQAGAEDVAAAIDRLGVVRHPGDGPPADILDQAVAHEDMPGRLPARGRIAQCGVGQEDGTHRHASRFRPGAPWRQAGVHETSNDAKKPLSMHTRELQNLVARSKCLFRVTFQKSLASGAFG